MMIKLFLAVFLAAQSPAKEQAATDSACAAIGESAVAIFEARQREIPLSRALEIVNSQPDDLRALFRMMILDAYDNPAYSTAEYQQRGAVEFRNKWELYCHTELFS